MIPGISVIGKSATLMGVGRQQLHSLTVDSFADDHIPVLENQYRL